MADDPTRIEPMYLWPTVTAFPDALDVLPVLAGQAALCLATNAGQSDEPMIRKALARVGIDRYFDHIFCFRGVGRKKTEPGFWRFLLRALAARADEVWMIGDSFEGDVVPASQAGIYSVWLNRRTPEDRTGAAFCTIHNLNQLRTTFNPPNVAVRRPRAAANEH